MRAEFDNVYKSRTNLDEKDQIIDFTEMKARKINFIS